MPGVTAILTNEQASDVLKEKAASLVNGDKKVLAPGLVGPQPPLLRVP
jgi:hypothetical protein